jgi:hypothetical protein
MDQGLRVAELPAGLYDTRGQAHKLDTDVLLDERLRDLLHPVRPAEVSLPERTTTAALGMLWWRQAGLARRENDEQAE